MVSMDSPAIWKDHIYNTIEVVGNITNPLDDFLLAPAWTYMTNNFSKFTISFWFSIIWHEVGEID